MYAFESSIYIFKIIWISFLKCFAIFNIQCVLLKQFVYKAILYLKKNNTNELIYKSETDSQP